MTETNFRLPWLSFTPIFFYRVYFGMYTHKTMEIMTNCIGQSLCTKCCSIDNNPSGAANQNPLCNTLHTHWTETKHKLAYRSLADHFSGFYISDKLGKKCAQGAKKKKNPHLEWLHLIVRSYHSRLCYPYMKILPQGNWESREVGLWRLTLVCICLPPDGSTDIPITLSPTLYPPTLKNTYALLWAT